MNRFTFPRPLFITFFVFLYPFPIFFVPVLIFCAAFVCFIVSGTNFAANFTAFAEAQADALMVKSVAFSPARRMERIAKMEPRIIEFVREMMSKVKYSHTPYLSAVDTFAFT